MKKYSVLIMFLLILGLVGCSSQTTNNSQNNNTKETKAAVETKRKYNIDKIVVPLQRDMIPDVKVYQSFNIAVVQEMAKENNIKFETREFATFNDINIALERGDVNVVPGIVQTYRSDKFTLTYSYFTGALYRENGEQLDSEKSYSMLVRKDAKELFDFFNDMISKFNETGKLKELQQQYLGERNKVQ